VKLYKVRKSKIDNYGLYATKDIKKGTRVIEYKGKIITRREA
jgi:SET domain-containing protein